MKATLIIVIFLALLLSACGGTKMNIEYSSETYYANPVQASDEAVAASDIILKRAKKLFAKQKYGKVVNFCEQAIELNHRNWGAHYYLGLAMQKKHEYVVSVQALMVGLKYSPDNKFIKSDLHYSIGLSLERMGDLDNAFEEYGLSLNFHSGNRSARKARNRVKIEKTMQDWSKSRQIDYDG